MSWGIKRMKQGFTLSLAASILAFGCYANEGSIGITTSMAPNIGNSSAKCVAKENRNLRLIS